MTPRRLLLSPHAAIDLEEIAEYIARDNPVRGRKLRRRVGSEMPGGRRDAELYPARTDLAPGLRMAVHGRMSCCIATCRARMPCASNAWCTVPATCRGWSDRRNRRELVLGTRPSIKRDLDCGIAGRGSCIHRGRYLLSLKAYPRLLRAAGSTMIAIRRPDGFCWCRILRSVVTRRSKPACSAAVSRAPLLSRSRPLAWALTTV